MIRRRQQELRVREIAFIMSILADKKTRVIVQGITGKTGSFHCELSLKAGTNIIAGVSPSKGGTTHLGIPLFDTIESATLEVGPMDAALIYVPALQAREAIEEAIDNDIRLIVVLTEGIPISDMVRVRRLLEGKPLTLIGPNCPGLLVPGRARLGIIPASISPKGKIGIVSRSGTLTYEAAYQIGACGLGVSTVVGIGGDPVIGTDFVKVLDFFDQDPETEAALMIGEIGGPMEEDAALYWSRTLGRRKPLFGLVAGKTAPKSKRMGHAGAIMEGTKDSAQAKIDVMAACGVTMIESLTDIGKTVSEALKKSPA